MASSLACIMRVLAMLRVFKALPKVLFLIRVFKVWVRRLISFVSWIKELFKGLVGGSDGSLICPLV